jgi:acyl carrier protein
MSTPDVVSLFRKLAAEIEGKDFAHVQRQTRVSELGIDSVSMMEIVGCIEDELRVKIPDDQLAQLQTVGDIERAFLDRL